MVWLSDQGVSLALQVGKRIQKIRPFAHLFVSAEIGRLEPSIALLLPAKKEQHRNGRGCSHAGTPRAPKHSHSPCEIAWCVCCRRVFKASCCFPLSIYMCQLWIRSLFFRRGGHQLYLLASRWREAVLPGHSHVLTC